VPRKSIDTLISELASTKDVIAKLNKEVDKNKKEKAVLEQKILAHLHDKNLDSVRANDYQATISTQDCYNVEDFDVFLQHVRKTKAWDLLTRRVNTTALKDRLSDGKKMPNGIAVFIKESLSFRKVAKK